MRIFVVCADAGIAPDGTKGASIHLRSLALAMQRAGHDVTMFSARTPGRDIGLPVVPLAGPEGLLAAADAAAPDVIYERYSLGHVAGMEAARRLGCTFALEVNAPLVDEARRHRPAAVSSGDEALERRLFLEADVVFAVSSGVADRLRAAGRPLDRTVIVPNGCDVPCEEVPPSGEGPAVLGFLGHPKPWHGADRLPRILAGVRAAGRDARLLVIGGGPGVDGVLRAAADASVEGHVTVTGAVDHGAVPSLLASVTLGLAPYRPDPDFYFCPIKVIEYMAAGVPVVASDLGDVPSLLGGGGVLVDPGSDDAFVDAIVHLLDDPGGRAACAAAGRDRARTRFTWDAAAARVAAALGRAWSEGLAVAP